MTVLKQLWRDDAGVTYTIEVILVATIAGIGLVVGLTTLRDSVSNELADVAGAVDSMVQSFVVNGITGHSATVNGSLFTDQNDFCDSPNDPAGRADQCLVQNIPANRQETLANNEPSGAAP